MNTFYLVSEILKRVYIKPKKEYNEPRTYKSIKTQFKNKEKMRRVRQAKIHQQYKKRIQNFGHEIY